MEENNQNFEFDFANGKFKNESDATQIADRRENSADVVKTNGLCKIYKDKLAVNDVYATIKKGDIYGLIGKNGAGKTTLFKLLLGLAKPNQGTLELFGSSENLLESRKKIGYLIEYPAFAAKLTAYENLKYLALQKGCFDDAKIRNLIDLVGLGGETTKKFSDYSLGMKQRLGIAFALLGEPELLILDEPVNGLDPEAIQAVRNLLIRLNREKGMTILISSHLISELSKVATCYGVMANGKLIKQITEDELNETVKPYIKLMVDDTAKTVEVLKSMGATKIKLANSGKVFCFDILDKLTEVSKNLAAAGVVIFSITEVDGDVENYFISLLGGATL